MTITSILLDLWRGGGGGGAGPGTPKNPSQNRADSTDTLSIFIRAFSATAFFIGTAGFLSRWITRSIRRLNSIPSRYRQYQKTTERTDFALWGGSRNGS